ncbi:MAG: hypothetical protein D6780_07575 [Candidatus Dadabacteria bacterium]|nr:MAG: hypothetical protein D6780_07575 [Candidatus Dadabacteria bacterium]
MQVKRIVQLCLFWLITFFSFVSHPVLAYASPRIGKSVNFKRFYLSREGDKFLVTFKTKEGLQKYLFKRIKSYKPQCFLNGERVNSALCGRAKLFRGKAKTKNKAWNGNKLASASIVNGELKINFFGKRGKRAYTAVFYKKRLRRFKALPLRVMLSQVNCSVKETASAMLRGELAPLTLPLPSGTLEIVTDADQEFLSNFSDVATANQAIQAILNNVETFYTSQLGVNFVLRGQNVFTDSATEPYTSTDPNTLLNQFSSYGESHNHLPARDIAHLFTGKDITGDTAGFAFVGSVCTNPDQAYSLSEHKSSSLVQSIITAHEIGHNFGAEHDDSSPPSIMKSSISDTEASQITGFSSKSLNEIASHLAQDTTCLTSDALERPTLTAKHSRKGKLSVTVENIGEKGCKINLQLVNGNTVWTLNPKAFKVSKKEAKKDKMVMTAKKVKINPSAISSFQLRIKKSCSGSADVFSLTSDGLVTTATKKGSVSTFQDLANTIARTLKKKKLKGRKKKKRRKKKR